MAELTPLEIEARRVASEDLDRVFAGMLRRALLIMGERAEKSFDPNAHPRHPEGTAVDPDTGAGGGRFAPKDGEGSLGTYSVVQKYIEDCDRLAEERIREALISTGYTEKFNEQYVIQCITDILVEHTKKKPISIRVHPYAVEEILKDGRVQSQFETNTSNGVYNPHLRKKAENRGLGIPIDTEDQFRPVYGYFDLDGNASHLYGNVEITLKESVKGRATITLSDSLSGFDSGSLYGLPFADLGKHKGAGWIALSPLDAVYFVGAEIKNNKINDLMGSAGYLEAQIPGGVSVSDIKKIVFHVRAFEHYFKDAFTYVMGDMSIVEREAKKSGVKFVVRVDEIAQDFTLEEYRNWVEKGGE